MAKAKRYLSIGGRTFDTKTHARIYCKLLLAHYADGETVGPKEHISFLTALLKRHPDATEKIGSGIKRLYRAKAPAPNYGTSCFWVERTDGSVIDFSMAHCFLTESDKAAIREFRGEQ